MRGTVLKTGILYPLNYLFFLLPLLLMDCETNLTSLDELDGYYFNFNVLEQALPDALIDTSTVFRINLERSVLYPNERRLIEKAEAFFPPESVFENQDDYNPNGEPRWWYGDFDGIRIPYAITGSSVDYYVSLIRYFQKGEFDAAGTIRMQSASVTYTSAAKHYDSFIFGNERFTDVYVVSQELKWKNYCGILCALWFTKTRMIVFDSNENVIAVFGDGSTIVIVS